ncbi:mediator complex subunit [Teratosphaeriaceae sp. CCFEE 6253]|nr:mediator complex subunit [Teratosphaeriaceae sp. CCFEE 6253]
MPGRLLSLDEQGPASSQELKKDRSRAQDTGQDVASQPGFGQAALHANGQPNHGGSGATHNGTALADGDAEMTNGDHVDMSLALTRPADPPQLDQSWRDSTANKSLGTMIDRLAQQCFIDLNAALNKMTAEGQPADGAPKADGPVVDTAEISLGKKRHLMDFAHDQRDRFTKTLVLSDWSRNAEDMAKFIDIKVWQEKQRSAYNLAGNAIANTKLSAINFKVPAPNIEGAMELLATGKAAWVSDMGYIPPKRLTAKQLLKTLKNMNVILSTRLNLHDELPPHMQDFSIADGRATFAVPGEFEVDLSVADEETTSPFYFIDLRFLFCPSSNILNDQVRAHLEGRVNAALASKGLQGCYELLHNFVLTHKINLLRSQAGDLIRGKWFNCIKVEHLRRSLIVQYWSNVPGPKSWFEIGINSGKISGASEAAKRRATPQLSVRWFRKGQEVRDELLPFDWETLDLEECLMVVIGKHCFGKLGVARDGLHTLAADRAVADAVLEAEVVASTTTPHEGAVLRLRLPSLRKPLAVRVETVSGQYSILPPTDATLSCERTLNNEPTVDASRLLASLVCSVVQKRVHKAAELLGMREIRSLASVKPKFGPDVWQRTVFMVPGWGSQWALGVSFGLAGERWWVVQLKESRPSERSTTVLQEVTEVAELPVRSILGEQAVDISRSTLLEIERLAVAEGSHQVLVKQLRGLRIPYELEKPVAFEDNDDRRLNSGVVYLNSSALLRDTRDRSWKAWAANSIRISHHGIEGLHDSSESDDTPSLVRHDIRLTLEAGKMQHLRQHFIKSQDKDVAVNASGGLAVRIRTPFGEPFVEQIRTKLQSLEHLDRCLTVLHQAHCSPTVVSLAKLSFTYRAGPLPLTAQLRTQPDGSGLMRLKLEPADSNPHWRIRTMLEQSHNKPGQRAEEGFQLFIRLLAFTLPTLQALDRLESAHMAKRTAVVRARESTRYTVTYRAPLPECTLSVRLRSRRDGATKTAVWHVTVESKGRVTGIPETLANALKAVWGDKGDGWTGFGGDAVAEIRGIAAVLERVDDAVRKCELLDSAPPTSDGGALVAEAKPSAQLQQLPPPPQQKAPLKEPQKKPATEPTRPAAVPGKSMGQANVAKKREEPDYIMLD